SVRLRVDVEAKAGKIASVDLDEATIAAGYQVGIMASGLSGAAMAKRGYTIGLSDQTLAGYKDVANFSVHDGSILQGRSGGYGGSPIFSEYVGGSLDVQNVETFASGVDTVSLDALGAKGPVTVRNSTFRQDIPNITDRMSTYSTVDLR